MSGERDERIDEIVKQYTSASERGNTYFVSQLAQIKHILHDIESEHFNETRPIVHWDVLLQQMRNWNTTWESNLIRMYENLLQTRLVQHPGDGEYTVGSLTEPNVTALMTHGSEALATFQTQQWSAEFVKYKADFFTSVERYHAKIEQRKTRGRDYAVIPYQDMQFTYLALLQHVFDVPTINDQNVMQYRIFEDAGMIQQSLQKDHDFIDLLTAAGECVLFLDEDAMNPAFEELPYLFHEMVHYYDYIDKSIRSKMAMQSHPSVEEFDPDLETDEILEPGAEMDEQHSQNETQPMDQDAQMTTLLRQLQQMNSD